MPHNQPTKTPPARIFVAYAHEDEASREELVKHLAALKSAGLIADWYDRRIMAGAEWQGEINKHLKRADLVLLLISADFLNSEYCMDVEFKEALKLQKANAVRVIPIIIRPAMWQMDGRLATLQVLPKDGKPVTLWEDEDVAYVDIADGIRRAALQLHAKRARAQTPKTAQKPVRRSTGATASTAAKANASQLRTALSRFTLKRLLKQVLFTISAAAVGAGFGYFASEVVLRAQNQPPQPSLSMLFAIAGAVTCGLLSLLTTVRSKSKVVEQLSRPDGAGQSTSPRRDAISEIARWRAIAGRQFERKELFKAAFVETRERLTRSRAVFRVVALVALVHIVTAGASSVILDLRGGASPDDPVLIKYLQSIMLFAGVALVSAGVFILYWRQSGAKEGLWSPLLIGGCGTFLAGLFFLFQVTPELVDLIIKNDPQVLTILPGLPNREPFKVAWLSYFVVQKLGVLPMIGAASAVLVMPFLQAKHSAS